MTHQITKTPNSDELSEADRFPPIIFTSNPVNSDFRVTLRNSLVLKDDTSLGAIFIHLHLSQIFPISGWNWIVRALPTKKFLVEPPLEDWKKKNFVIWSDLVRWCLLSYRTL
jgi:hypothetical protein